MNSESHKKLLEQIEELSNETSLINHTNKNITAPPYSDWIYALIANQPIDEIIELRRTKKRDFNTIHVTSCIDLKWQDFQRTSFEGHDMWAKIVSMYNHFSDKYNYRPIELVEWEIGEYENRNKNKNLFE